MNEIGYVSLLIEIKNGGITKMDDDNIVDNILDEMMNDSKDKSNKKINRATNDILNLKRKAFTDQEAAKKLNLLYNMVTVKDFEKSDFAKDMLAIPDMMEGIQHFFEANADDALSILGIDYITEYMVAIQEFAARLKPLYVRLLIYEEMSKNGQ